MDMEKLRQDFPVLNKLINGKKIIYMDSACMSLKPRQVMQAMNDYYENFPACAGRSMHKLSTQVEEARRRSRETMQKFIGAKKAEEIIFTRNTTEGLNIVLNSLDLGKGDTVLTTDREHNSNLLPCHLLAERKGVRHMVVNSKPDFTFDMEAFKRMLTPGVKLVSFVYTSNIDGYTLPVREIIKAAHDNGSLVMLDGAQAVPHRGVNVNKLGADFLAFSGHKMLGPTGTGILYVKQEHYDKLRPFMVGGETVEWSTYESHKFLKPPEMFEAGLQNYAGEMGLAAAAKYLESVGMDNIEKHENELTKMIHEGISGTEGVKIIGVSSSKMASGIVSFLVDKVGLHQVAIILDQNHNIMVRSGQHCAHSWFRGHGVEGSVRASLYLYNTKEEAERLIEALKEIIKLR